MTTRFVEAAAKAGIPEIQYGVLLQIFWLSLTLCCLANIPLQKARTVSPT